MDYRAMLACMLAEVNSSKLHIQARQSISAILRGVPITWALVATKESAWQTTRAIRGLVTPLNTLRFTPLVGTRLLGRVYVPYSHRETRFIGYQLTTRFCESSG